MVAAAVTADGECSAVGQRGGAAIAIHAPGVVEGIGRQLDLRLEVAGRISEVLIKEGDYVRDGQLLVRLDDATQRHHVQALQGELQFAQARLERLKNGDVGRSGPRREPFTPDIW